MTGYSDPIERYYDAQVDSEWERMDRHRTEFALTMRTLKRYLPPPPCRLLDCGGGPGRYSIELAKLGYQVTLFDLSRANLDTARRKSNEAGVQLAGYEKGTAVDLSRFEDKTFDAVLMLGPLYHLLDVSDRKKAVQEASRVIKPGSPLFAAFICRYAGLRYVASEEAEKILQYTKLIDSILEKGYMPPGDPTGQGFQAYVAHPNEIEPLLKGQTLDVKEIIGVEGLVSQIDAVVNTLEGEAWDAWVNLNEHVSRDPSLLGATEHILAVALKPAWRSVLKTIVKKLDDHEIPYVVTGGTSAALHGASVRVKDIDIELDEQGAYRFQELFNEYLERPVSIREGDKETIRYRSAFGMFRMDGIQVEVMGGTQRWENNRWVDTFSLTRELLELDGYPVQVTWLEEEVLAYIRRGRIERAAVCLQHCDAKRLQGLVKGEIKTNVI